MINSNEYLVIIYPKTPQEAKNHSTRHLSDATDKLNPIYGELLLQRPEENKKSFRAYIFPCA